MIRVFRCVNCGEGIKLSMFALIQLYLRKQVNVCCKNCGYKSNYKLISRIVRDNTVKFDENKDLEKNKKAVHKRG